MMFRKKQLNSETPSPAGLLVRAARRKLQTRAAAALAAGVMLVTALGTLGYAWYTRTVNTYAVTFEVAEYDLSVNENVEDSYLLDIYRYSSVQNNRFAPGMYGYMPMNIAVYHSDIDVEYTIELVNKMPDDVRDHIGIFYLEEKSTDANGHATWKPYYGDALELTTELKDIPANDTGKEVTIDTETKTLRRKYLRKENESAADPFIRDVLKIAPGERRSKKLCLYWVWFLDKEAAKKAGAATITATTGTAEYQKEIDDWDAQDTDIGRYPQKYMDAFYVYLNASGTQINPDKGARPTPTPQTS